MVDVRRFPYHCPAVTGGHMHQLDGARILVIGGAGFLGSHIVDQLTETPAREIVVLDDFVRGTRDEPQRMPFETHASAWSRAASPIVPLLRRAHGRHRLRVPSRRAVAVRVRATATQGPRGQRRRDVQRHRGGADAGVKKVVYIVVGVGLRRRRVHADDRGPSVQQPHHVRRHEDRRRAVLPGVLRAATG